MSFLSFRLSRLAFVRHCSTLRAKPKLSEVPDICSSGQWSQLILEARKLLPAADVYRNHGFKVKSEDVVQALEKSHAVGSRYLAQTFRHLLSDNYSTTPELRWPGLLTMLLFQSTQHKVNADFMSKRLKDVVWSLEVQLAEVLNLLYCSHLFQREYRRWEETRRRSKKSREYQLARTWLVVSGVLKTLALDNEKVSLMMSRVLESLTESSPSIVLNVREWEHKTFYPLGQLLATGCQSALELAGFGERVQQMAFDFGYYTLAAITANDDIRRWTDYQKSLSTVISLSSLPIALHLQKNPETLSLISQTSLDNLRYNQLNELLLKERTYEDAKIQLSLYVQKAEQLLLDLQSGENNEATQCLFNILKTLEDV